jgi:hypothetical protein
MPKPYANDPRRHPQVGSPEFTRLLFVAFGIALLLGLVSGSIWIAWNLIRLHVLR